MIPSISTSFPIASLIGSENIETKAKIIALIVASYLTEPICKVREYFYTFYILDKICHTTTQKTMKIASLILGIGVFTLLTPFTAPFGVLIRGIVSTFESEPYIYLKKAEKGKTLPEGKTITLVSHNQCYMPAGYSITDGQVTPHSDGKRMDANISMVKERTPDIVCLYEVPDIVDACSLSSKLPEYPFIIPVAGVRGVGPSSMMYVASKYEIVKSSIKFVRFEKGTELTGRAQFSEKGFLSFAIKNPNEEHSFATIVSTHLQHSEIPAQPKVADAHHKDSDVDSRAAQMKKIALHIEQKLKDGHSLIFTGDLNQEEQELNAFLVRENITWLRRDSSIQGQPTWDGDQWCAELTGKEASGPLVLDYTFIAGKATNIATKIIKTGYCGKEFRPEATSDHELLFSTITLG